VFGVGLLGFLFSKEIWVYEHQLPHFLSFWLVMYILVWKAGPRVRKYVDEYDAVCSSLSVHHS